MSDTRKSGGALLPLVLFLSFSVLVFIAVVFGGSAPAARQTNPDYLGIETNEERIALIASFGWKCEETPHEMTEVSVPLEFDSVYEAYNELQKPLGLDLYPLRGRTLRRYTYVLTNHPDSGTVYATLLFSLDEFVGGDVCSAAPDGFVQCLKKGA